MQNLCTAKDHLENTVTLWFIERNSRKPILYGISNMEVAVFYFEVLSRKLSSGNLLRKLRPSLFDDTGSAQGLEKKISTVQVTSNFISFSQHFLSYHSGGLYFLGETSTCTVEYKNIIVKITQGHPFTITIYISINRPNDLFKHHGYCM